MKKLLSLLAAIALVFTLGACEPIPNTGSGNGGNVPAPASVTVYAPDGAPAVAISKIINDGKIGNTEATVNIVAGADLLTTNVANGSADVAVMPVNLAAKTYNGGVKIKLVSVNIFGCLYMVGKTPVTALTDLVGKVVYNIGRGGTPDLTLKYVLQKNNIAFVESETAVEGKVALQYVSAGSELIPMLKNGSAEYGVLGEPAVTQCNKVAGTSVVLNLQEEWKKVAGEDYTQAGVVVKQELAESEEFMTALTAVLGETTAWASENASSIKGKLNGAGSTLAVEFTPEIITKANLGYQIAGQAKSKIEAYFNVLMGFNAKLIGDKLPDANFYYGV